MSQEDSSEGPSREEDSRLFEVIAGFMNAAQRGEAPDPEELLAKHPEFRPELQEFLSGHEALAKAMGSDAGGKKGKVVPLLPREFGEYELLEPIQRGGMGVVYRARHRDLDRVVALKVILSGPLASEAELERFVREAKAAAQLDHPNIVPALDAGEFSGYRYYTMPLITGSALSESAEDFSKKPREAAALVETLALALQHAHERGVLHRDLKPGNVLVDEEGAPHIVDFGLAKLIDEDATITQTGAVIGTPAYMSPELASGEKGAATTATDIYSLGTILYELITGHRPFHAGTPIAVMTQVKYQEPHRPSTRNPEVDPDLETICLRCLEKDPKRRFPSAVALAEELRRYLDGQPIHSRPVRMPERAWKWAKRRPALASLVGLLGLSLTVLLVGAILYNVQLRRTVDRSRRSLFAAEMSLAAEAWNEGQIRYMRSLLMRHLPDVAGSDLRSFEWRHLWGLADSLVVSVSHQSYGRCGAFDPQDRFLAIGYGDGDAVLVDLETRTRVLGFETDHVAVNDLAFSPDSRHVAGVRGEPGVKKEFVLWSAETGLVEHALDLPGDIPRGVAFVSPTALITCDAAGQLMVWERETWKLVGTVEVGRKLRHLDVSADSRTVCLVDKSGSPAAVPLAPAEIVRAPTAVEILEQLRKALPVAEWQAVRSVYGATALSLAPDQHLVASVPTVTDRGARIVIHGAGSAEPAGQFSMLTVANFVVFSPGGKFIALGGRDTRVWKIANLLEPGILETRAPVSSTAVAPGGRFVATGNGQGRVVLRDVDTGAEIASFQTGVGKVSAVAISPDGASIAVGGEFGHAIVWSPGSGDVPSPLGPHRGVIRSLVFSPDGTQLAVGSFRRVLVWDLARRTARKLVTDSGSVFGLAFSPGGDKLWLGHQDGSLAAWTPRTGKYRILIPSGETRVSRLAVSADGSFVAIGHSEGRLSLYDTRRERIAFSRRGHARTITALAFSPDGKSLVSAGMDLHLKFWDLPMGQLRVALGTRAPPVNALGFTADGTQLSAMDLLGRIRTWHATPELVDPDFPPLNVAGWEASVPGLSGVDPQEPTHWVLVENPSLHVGGGCQGLAWEDPDGDGDLDLFLACVGPDRYLRNEGKGKLVDATGSSFSGRRNSKGVAWGDLDGDGDLDLCVTNRDGPNRFFANDGRATFSDWPGVYPAGEGRSPAIALADYDLDGDIDAFICRAKEKCLLLRNDGLTFVDVSGDREAITAPATSAAWGDFTGDGRPDLLLCAAKNKDRLLQNLGNGEFADVSRFLVVNPPDGNSRCAAWGDYDNDGDLDLYVCRRRQPNCLFRNDGEHGFTDVTVAPLGDRRFGLGSLWGDYDNDGDLDLFVGNNDGRSKLFRNDGGTERPTFTDVTTGPLRGAGSVYAMAWADYDGDGDLDLTVSDWDDAVRLFRNDIDIDNHWLRVRLRGKGWNTAGIGARVRATTEGRSQLREISGGSSPATLPLLAHFGLGKATRVDELEIHWPDGYLQRLQDVPVDQVLVVHQEESREPGATADSGGSDVRG